MNNRNTRIESAKQTLQIIENRKYYIQNQIIDLSSAIEQSILNTKLYTPELLDLMLQDNNRRIGNDSKKTIITIKNCSSMEAAQSIASEKKIGCLNFASAKNPGGGFLSGAQAQEESLARASTLYPTQMKFFNEMYEYNRKRSTYLYSDRMIYSPKVCFIKDDNDLLLTSPYCMDILTSPAVNIGAMIQNKKDEEFPLIEKTMLNRIDKILALFYANNIDTLILGAWGCGVFRNNPEDIARYFAHFLSSKGKYACAFNNIIFAVLDRSKNKENYRAFEKVFG